jgi:peptidoglycan/LPS O-acetylase OafA/YrhL
MATSSEGDTLAMKNYNSDITAPNCSDCVKRKASRWAFLDSARGVAAMLVVIEHSVDTNPILHGILFKYLNLGCIGVVTFFLISGFIIPASLERSGSQREFWVGRVFRLLPALWVNFAAVLVANFVLGTFSPAVVAHPLRYLVGNLAMVPEILRVPAGEGAYWTLQYELIFYVLTALLFALGLLQRSALWACTAGCFYLTANISIAAIYHHALSAEKCGVVATAFVGTLIFRHFQGSVRLPWIYIALSIMGAAVIVSHWLRLSLYVPAGVHGEMTAFCGISSFSLGYLLFALFFILRARAFPTLLLWLGKISYSVYLWHVFVLQFVPGTTPPLWRALIAIAVTLPIASLSYTLIEAPAQSLCKRIGHFKIFRRKARACNPALVGIGAGP